jgi:hypothetical protein
MLVRPENRLVADNLEGQWNEKLAQLAEAEEEYARAAKKEGPELTTEDRHRIATKPSESTFVGKVVQQHLWSDLCPAVPRSFTARWLRSLSRSVRWLLMRQIVKLPRGSMHEDSVLVGVNRSPAPAFGQYAPHTALKVSRNGSGRPDG